jgi:hypothetical protein
MEPRTEDKKSRFEIDKLEPRIAPGNATAGLNNALDSALPHVETTPAPVQFVVDTVTTNNPQA